MGAEFHFMELVRYIHLNPVRAGIIKTLGELATYPWTGHPAMGSGDFVAKIQTLAEQQERHQRTIQDAFSMDSLLALAAQTTGVAPALLRGTDRNRLVSKARALFSFGATEWLRRPGAEIGQLLGITSSAVSAARRQGRQIADVSGFAALLQAHLPH